MFIHVSTVHPRNDTRIFIKQISSISKNFPDKKVYFLVADGLGDYSKNNISIIDFGRPENRFSRFITKQFQVYKFLRKLSPELIHFHDPELLIISWILSKRNKNVIYDAHEDYRIDILTREWIPKKFKRVIAFFFGFLEDKIIKNLTGVIAATPSIKERLQNNTKSCITINNYPLLSEFSTIPSKKDCLYPFRICYIGAISIERGLTEIVDTLNNFQSDVILELGGTFSDKNYEKILRQREGWRYVKYHGQVTREEMKRIFSKSSLGLVTYHPVKSHLMAQPNKLFDYLSAGLPILCSNFEHWMNMFNEKNYIFYVDPTDTSSIEEGLNFFISKKEKLSNFGEDGRQFVKENFSWESEEKKLVNFYSNHMVN